MLLKLFLYNTCTLAGHLVLMKDVTVIIESCYHECGYFIFNDIPFTWMKGPCFSPQNFSQTITLSTSACWFSTVHPYAIISPRFQCTFHLIQEKVRPIRPGKLLLLICPIHINKSWLPDVLSGNSNFLPH